MKFTFWPYLLFPVLNNFVFVMLCFLFMNFLSPFFFSLHKTDALIFRHKALLLDEGGREKEKTAGTLTCFTGLLGTFEVLFKLSPENGGPGQGLFTFCFSLSYCNSVRFLEEDCLLIIFISVIESFSNTAQSP